MYASTDPADTDAEWIRILACCARNESVGFGLLDSFLSGRDIDRRIDLVVTEAKTNLWLRLELRDTLTLNQSVEWTEWTALQHTRLRDASVSAVDSGE